MTPAQTALLLREMEACQAIFETLSLLLDNNAAIKDYRSLAVLADLGRRKMDDILDLVIEEG